MLLAEGTSRERGQTWYSSTSGGLKGVALVTWEEGQYRWLLHPLSTMLRESLAPQDTGHFELKFPLVSDKGKMLKM